MKMSVKNEQAKSTNGRNSAKTSNRLERRRNRGTGINGADIGSANPDRLLEAICAVTKSGCLITFGYTQDGGAIVVNIYEFGSEPIKEYVRATEDFDVYLGGLIEDFDPGSTA